MKVGDEVYLREDSEWNNGSDDNPIGTKGTVVDIDAVENEYLPIGVDWGFSRNSYKSSDLILASEYGAPAMNQGHPNASILMEIAKEAAVNPEYWKEYEVKFNDELAMAEWIVCRNESDLFYGLQNDINIRRKPSTIRIGKYDVPEPMRSSQPDCEYYMVNLPKGRLDKFLSFDSPADKINFNSGLCQQTKEGAELMLKALQELLCKK